MYDEHVRTTRPYANVNAGRQLGPDPWQNRHIQHKRACPYSQASNTVWCWLATEPWRFVVYTGRARGKFVQYVRDWYKCVILRGLLAIFHQVDDSLHRLLF